MVFNLELKHHNLLPSRVKTFDREQAKILGGHAQMASAQDLVRSPTQQPSYQGRMQASSNNQHSPVPHLQVGKTRPEAGHVARKPLQSQG